MNFSFWFRDEMKKRQTYINNQLFFSFQHSNLNFWTNNKKKYFKSLVMFTNGRLLNAVYGVKIHFQQVHVCTHETAQLLVK